VSHLFFERALFSNRIYCIPRLSYGKKIKTGVIVTNRCSASFYHQFCGELLNHLTGLFGEVFGSCEVLGSHDTQQVENDNEYDIQDCVPAKKYVHHKK
jgi:hypothetical protein